MIMGLLIKLEACIIMSLMLNKFQYFRNNEAEYFGKSVELWLVNHSLSHLSTFLALHPVNAYFKVDQIFPFYLLDCKLSFNCPDYGSPLSVTFFTVNTYLYLSCTEFGLCFGVEWFHWWIHKIITILFHCI